MGFVNTGMAVGAGGKGGPGAGWEGGVGKWAKLPKSSSCWGSGSL